MPGVAASAGVAPPAGAAGITEVATSWCVPVGLSMLAGPVGVVLAAIRVAGIPVVDILAAGIMAAAAITTRLAGPEGICDPGACPRRGRFLLSDWRIA